MGRFAAKPLTNPIVGRSELFRKRIEPKLNGAKQKYSELFMPEKYKKQLKKEKGNYDRRN